MLWPGSRMYMAMALRSHTLFAGVCIQPLHVYHPGLPEYDDDLPYVGLGA